MNEIQIKRDEMNEIQIKRERILVTLDLARRWLDNRAPNRHIKPGTIKELVQVIEDGRWNEDVNTIKFYRDDVEHPWAGKLFDGQNRLLALTQTGVPLFMWTASGFNFDATLDTDTGAKRTFADVLMIMGYNQANGLAALTRSFYAWEHGDYRTRSRPRGNASYSRYLELVNKHSTELLEAVRHGQTTRGMHDQPTAMALCYLVLHRIDPGECDRFFSKLIKGTDLPEGSPILALRHRFDKHRDARRGKRGDPIGHSETTALVIKAWNAWMRGDQLHTIRWNPGGSLPEAFPHPYDPNHAT